MSSSEGDEQAAAIELIATFALGDYLEATIVRRLRQRMIVLDLPDLGTYRDYVRRSPSEIESLRAFLPISHTAFFRDAPRWEPLASTIVPELLARKETVRIWSAGCATGEEAYSLAMLLCEHTGIEALARRVSIFATDACTASLAVARSGKYDGARVAAVPPRLRETYLPRGTVHPALRSVVHFARHDVLNDAPFMRVDLLACRNTLVYMRRAAQAHVLAKLHVALAEGGVLFSGPADGLALHRHLFQRVEAHLYRPRAGARRQALLAAGARRG